MKGRWNGMRCEGLERGADGGVAQFVFFFENPVGREGTRRRRRYGRLALHKTLDECIEDRFEKFKVFVGDINAKYIFITFRLSIKFPLETFQWDIGVWDCPNHSLMRNIFRYSLPPNHEICLFLPPCIESLGSSGILFLHRMETIIG